MSGSHLFCVADSTIPAFATLTSGITANSLYQMIFNGLAPVLSQTNEGFGNLVNSTSSGNPFVVFDDASNNGLPPSTFYMPGGIYRFELCTTLESAIDCRVVLAAAFHSGGFPSWPSDYSEVCSVRAAASPTGMPINMFGFLNCNPNPSTLLYISLGIFATSSSGSPNIGLGGSTTIGYRRGGA